MSDIRKILEHNLSKKELQNLLNAGKVLDNRGRYKQFRGKSIKWKGRKSTLRQQVRVLQSQLPTIQLDKDTMMNHRENIIRIFGVLGIVGIQSYVRNIIYLDDEIVD